MIKYPCHNISCFHCEHLINMEKCLRVKFLYKHGKIYVESYDSELVCSKNAMRCLCYLVQNEGQLVERGDLEGFIWECRSVGINSLPVLLHEVRRVLALSSMELMTIRSRGVVFQPRGILDKDSRDLLKPSVTHPNDKEFLFR